MNTQDVLSQLLSLVPLSSRISLSSLATKYQDHNQKKQCFYKATGKRLGRFLEQHPNLFHVNGGEVTQRSTESVTAMENASVMSTVTDLDDLLLQVKAIICRNPQNMTIDLLCQEYLKETTTHLKHIIARFYPPETRVIKWLRSFPAHFVVHKKRKVTLRGLITAESFQEKANACREDREEHRRVVDVINNQLKTRMAVPAMLSGGSIAKGTNVKGKADCDLVMLFRIQPDDDWFNTLRESLKRAREELACTPNIAFRNDAAASRHVAFTQRGIDVDLLAGVLFGSQDQYEAFYAQQIQKGVQNIAWLNPSACKWQVEKIGQLEVWVKDIICVLKAWRDCVFDKDAPGCPKSYLIELLVKRAAEEVGDQDRIKIIHRFFDIVEQQPQQIWDVGNRHNNIVADFDWMTFVKKAKLARPAGPRGPIFLIE
eukprot:GILJ01009054.1.p1 GENE.GILJ01009054.1~~GILJ01009054.1.p1  ORF type:complete len:428 (-),score=59.19 GILJ01009054.1:118-1401(-)